MITGAQAPVLKLDGNDKMLRDFWQIGTKNQPELAEKASMGSDMFRKDSGEIILNSDTYLL